MTDHSKHYDDTDRNKPLERAAQPIADVSAPTDELAAFEAWARTAGCDARLLERSSATVGAYAWSDTQSMWQAWQAARAAAPESGPSDA